MTLKDDSVSHAQEIEEYLQSKLPPYMVPQVVVINKIPLLINGKTDRQYLLKFYEESNNNGNYRSFPLKRYLYVILLKQKKSNNGIIIIFRVL